MPDRKVISLQTSDRTATVQERLKYEESTIKTSTDDIDNPPKELLTDETARKEYFRVLKELRYTVGIVGNLNMADLATYANNYSRYVSCVKQTQKRGFKYVIDTDSGPKENPVCLTMDKAQRNMMDAERRLGMTFDGILKAAAARVKKEEEQMEERFGGI